MKADPYYFSIYYRVIFVEILSFCLFIVKSIERKCSDNGDQMFGMKDSKCLAIKRAKVSLNFATAPKS